VPLEVVAPGKLVVAGEYAVVDGGVAVVAAIDRGVRCIVTAGEGVTTPGDDRFVRAGLLAVSAPARHYAFTDAKPAVLADKPGFGGSAAATVAACAAGLLARHAPLDTLLETALSVHHTVQGSGSGIDVRASVAGGVRRWPGGIARSLPRLTAIYSGRSASTGPRVQRYLAWSDRARFVDESNVLVAALDQDPVAALEALRELLVAMSRAAGIDYLTDAHARIAALARDHGGAAKPSGAGGGDIAVAVVPDPDARTAFEAACSAERLPPIAIEAAELSVHRA